MRKFLHILAVVCLFVTLSSPLWSQQVTQSLGIYSRSLRGQLQGTTTNDAATAGNIGEQLIATRETGSASSLTSTTANSVASISVTAGDWDIDGAGCFNTAATTTVTTMISYISANNNSISGLAAGNHARVGYNALVLNTNSHCFSVPPQRVSLAGTTTYYITVYGEFGASTLTGWGAIRARRVR